MSGTWGGIGRIVAIGIGLALAALLVLATEATAGRYVVAQCGWHAGIDADWADTTGGQKFRPDHWCATSGDPFAGSQVRSLTTAAGSVSGNRFARWRWMAPAGTYLTQIRGTWWQALHDGIERRVGAVNWAGGFEALFGASGTDVPREFVVGFPVPVAGIEDRLLCARGEDRACSLASPSWSALRALTFTLEDEKAPGGGIGGDLTAPGWRRGPQTASIAGNDLGSGVRFGETLVDGARVALTEYPCAKIAIEGEWRAARMIPCYSSVSEAQSVQTALFGDGPHSLVHCVEDFSRNRACTVPRTVLFDNTAPASPRTPRLAGGEGWRRQNRFDLSWENPDQGAASPIVGAAWRLTGPGGHDSGARFAGGRDLRSLAGLLVPGPGTYRLEVWLRDEAGNEAPASAIGLPLRFDDVPPGVAFVADDGTPLPSLVEAEVSDAHSGPAQGTIYARRADSEHWIELPTKLVAVGAGTRLRAPLPELEPGTYLFRADVADAAGNTASTRRRADGTEMRARRVATPELARAAEAARERTRLFARLRGGRGRGETRTVPFGAGATLSGRLVRVDGAGAAGRELRVLARPSRGAVAEPEVATVKTGERGNFELRLDPGPSRRIAVSFAGDRGLEPSQRHPLELRVRSGLTLELDRERLWTGQLLRLGGRVAARGAAIPRRGKLVAVQYFEQATDRWRPVLVTRSDHDGRFRARYRFRYVSGSARIRLRATALAEERWPYAPGSSRPVTVDVRSR